MDAKSVPRLLPRKSCIETGRFCLSFLAKGVQFRRGSSFASQIYKSSKTRLLLDTLTPESVFKLG